MSANGKGVEEELVTAFSDFNFGAPSGPPPPTTLAGIRVHSPAIPHTAMSKGAAPSASGIGDFDHGFQPATAHSPPPASHRSSAHGAGGLLPSVDGMESVRNDTPVNLPPGGRMSSLMKVPDFGSAARQVLKIHPFSAKPGEDIRLWLGSIHYLFGLSGDIDNYKHFDGVEEFNAPLCQLVLANLKGDAALWCASLPPTMLLGYRRLYHILIDYFGKSTASSHDRRRKTAMTILQLVQGTKSITAYILEAKDIRYQCDDDQLKDLKHAFIHGLSDKQPFPCLLQGRLRDMPETLTFDTMLSDLIKYMGDKYQPEEVRGSLETATARSPTATAPMDEDAVARKVVASLGKLTNNFSFSNRPSGVVSNPQAQQQSQRYAPQPPGRSQAQTAYQPQARSQQQNTLGYQPQPRSQLQRAEGDQPPSSIVENMRCWKCCLKGHLTRDCPNPPAPREHQELARAESNRRREYYESLKENGYQAQTGETSLAPLPQRAAPAAARPTPPAMAVNNVHAEQSARWVDWSAYDDEPNQAVVANASAGQHTTTSRPSRYGADWSAYDSPSAANVNVVEHADWPMMEGMDVDGDEYRYDVHTLTLERDIRTATGNNIDAAFEGASEVGTLTSEAPPTYDVWADINAGKGKPYLSFTELAKVSPLVCEQLRVGAKSQPRLPIISTMTRNQGAGVLPQVYTEITTMLGKLKAVPAHSQEVAEEMEQEGQSAVVHNAMLRQRVQTPLIMTHAMIRPLGGEKEWEISSVLIDCGGQINMINEKVVRELALLKVLEPGFAVFGYDGRRSAAAHYVNLPLRVAGVERIVEFYVVAGNTSYQLLLGIQWLTSVNCVIYFGTRDVFIMGKTGRPRKVIEQPHPAKVHTLELVAEGARESAYDLPPSPEAADKTIKQLLFLRDLLKLHKLAPGDMGYEDPRLTEGGKEMQLGLESGKVVCI